MASTLQVKKSLFAKVSSPNVYKLSEKSFRKSSRLGRSQSGNENVSRVDDWRASRDVTSPGCVLLTVGCIGPLLASLRESLCLQGVHHMFYMPACQLSAFTVILTSVLSSVR